MVHGARPHRVLFVQVADPAFYPPIMHAAAAMADAGWGVTILSTPQAGAGLETPAHPGIVEIRLPLRPSFKVDRRHYLGYVRAAIVTALQFRPDVVYASDPLAAGPGLLVAWLSEAKLVYHEHDSPSENMPGRLPMRFARYVAARNAKLTIFPNAERARIALARLGLSTEALRIVWNLPSLHDLPSSTTKSDAPVVVYYHGSITAERLPRSVPEAISRFGGAAILRIAGYEAPTGKGYLDELEQRWGRADAGGLIDWLGALPTKHDLLLQAARAHIGLALMPMASDDINMTHMTGASNKAFDYMAAEIALVVSDLSDWRSMYVEPGYGVACDPRNVDSVEAALRQLIDDPAKRASMARLSRQKIERQWHYEAAFRPIIELMEGMLDRGKVRKNVRNT